MEMFITYICRKFIDIFFLYLFVCLFVDFLNGFTICYFGFGERNTIRNPIIVQTGIYCSWNASAMTMVELPILIKDKLRKSDTLVCASTKVVPAVFFSFCYAKMGLFRACSRHIFMLHLTLHLTFINLFLSFFLSSLSVFNH